eukprot:3937256-Rhodomonas_salina.2
MRPFGCSLASPVRARRRRELAEARREEGERCNVGGRDGEGEEEDGDYAPRVNLVAAHTARSNARNRIFSTSCTRMRFLVFDFGVEPISAPDVCRGIPYVLRPYSR